jgi:hypothetical protein
MVSVGVGMVFWTRIMADIFFSHMKRTFYLSLKIFFPFFLSLITRLKNFVTQIFVTSMQVHRGMLVFWDLVFDEIIGVSKKLKWGADGL